MSRKRSYIGTLNAIANGERVGFRGLEHGNDR